MLHLAVKRNGFFVFFILFVAIIAAACGEEKSSSIPAASQTNCGIYDYSYTSTVTVSPSGGYSYGGVSATTDPPVVFDETTVGPAKVTITGGTPPFGVSAQSFVSLSLAYAGPFAFGTGFLSLAVTDAVTSANDPSCQTYVFWVVPEATVNAGTYTDEVTVTDAKGSKASLTLTITVTKS